ncbi:hypothetical protein GCM10020367_22200 [Streptomyces sannanensis]|uniref:Transcription factor zinc-finger domain-containing protein n=2 Tax=Streptomyces sannanensis TaxID=285536 RepID=A0ABP6S9Y7_9ACTN
MTVTQPGAADRGRFMALAPLRGHGRIGRPEGDGPIGRECGMPASREEVPGLPGAAEDQARLTCPSCGSDKVAQVLGDNGGVSCVCTACGHAWS